MRFEHSEYLWLLLVFIPALSAFFSWAWFKRRQLILQFVQSRLLAHLTVGVSTTRQKLRLVLAVAATALLIFALARPQWGFDWEEARQRGLDIVVAIDTSRSMLAADVSPNRLRRAKLAALDLKRLARSDRLGLVAFAGSAFLQCPLSLDDQAFRQSVEALDVSIIPQGGTALAEAIRTAMTAFEKGSDNHKVLVLFTDGEDHDGEALNSAEHAAKEGLRIFTIGVGTANGELLRLTDDMGRIEYVKDEKGQVVKSRLNEKLLRQIAQAANGFHMLLSGANTVDLLYKNGLEPLPKSEFGSRRLKRHHERFQWFLGLAIVLLMMEMFLPDQKRVSRPVKPGDGSGNAALRKSLVPLALALLLPVSAAASPGTALKAYRAGDFATAQLQYERALATDPSNAPLQFNAGAAAFQARDFLTAEGHFHNALVTDDLTLQQQAYYNLGNTLYRVGENTGDLNAKIQSWEEAVTHYESALKLNQHENAQYNLDLVKQRLEQLKQQQEQQQQQDDNQEEKDDQEQNDDPSKDQQDQEQQPSEQEQNEGEKDQQQESQQDQQQQEQQQQQQEQPSEQPNQPQDNPNNNEPSDPQNQAGQEGEESEENPDQAPPVPQTQVLQLTPDQAKQLLDAQKSEEKPMIFVPPKQRRATDRIFKDW